MASFATTPIASSRPESELRQLSFFYNSMRFPNLHTVLLFLVQVCFTTVAPFGHIDPTWNLSDAKIYEDIIFFCVLILLNFI